MLNNVTYRNTSVLFIIIPNPKSHERRILQRDDYYPRHTYCRCSNLFNQNKYRK